MLNSSPPCRGRALLLAAVVSLLPIAASAVSLDDTRLLQQPAISDAHVAFVYADDLWIAELPANTAPTGDVLDLGTARRLTSHVGAETNPRFSPDGQWLAFSAEYDGNRDVYVLPIAGGVAKRLTWHPDPDIVQDFTPDGRVLFASPRYDYARRHAHLFTVGTEGGFPERLPIPHAASASFSDDGAKIAYNPLSPAHLQWKNYRGGRVSRVWIYDVASQDVLAIEQPAERANDDEPFWLGGDVYLRSDRAGEFNLFRFDPETRALEQLTEHDDFPVLGASAGGGRIVYEQAGYLHLFDAESGQSTRLQIGVAADLVETRPRWESGDENIRTASLSPSGARAAFGFRGDIVTVPAKKGHPRAITASSDAHEREPVWSPDGRHLAYFTDASGEYTLDIAPQDGRGDVQRFELPGSGFYDRLLYSPDGRYLSFTDNAWSLYVLEINSGEVTKIAQEPIYGPVKTLHHAWSPDSRWLAYTLNTPVYFQQLHLYSLDDGSDHVITDGLADVGEPVFDRSGKYLYFSASTDAGPTRSWFAMSNADMEITRSLYLAVLAADEPSPLAAESDEEASPKEMGEGKDAAPKDADTKDAGKEESDDSKTVIDLDGLAQRILALPTGSGSFSNLSPGGEGQLYYLERSAGGGLFFQPSGSLKRFDLKTRKAENLADGVDFYTLSQDASKVLIASRRSWSISGTAKVDTGKGKIKTGDIRVRVDPRQEWRQIFDEAWRINRDFFYDPGMHGADWPAMREKYAAFLPHLATRGDLNRLIQWLCSELAVGHHRTGGGDRRDEPESIGGGLLGADFTLENGRYRFAKVYGGLNWNPDLRAPLTEPGVGVRAGDYLLAVDGQSVAAEQNIYSFFEATAGRIVELEVGANADGSDSRTVQVVPIRDELNLRNRDWVEGNIKKVDQATDGRVAYVHVPNTTRQGHEYFKRYFFPQAHKHAIIVDERHNGGGQVADYYIDILRRPYITHWAMRYGADLPTPLAAIHGPKVMLIDETAGSGGDLLPWMFRKLELGTLVGRRTWGGLVGILGFPVLLDGGRVTAPNLAIWTEDGFVVENEGVPPDVEVEQWPKDVAAGGDPQLEKAIEIVLEQLEANPPIERTRPPFPIRARQ